MAAQLTKSPANGWPGKATDFKYLKQGHNVWPGRSFEPDPKNAVAGHEPQSDSEPKPWTALMDPSGKQGPGRRPVAVVPTSVENRRRAVCFSGTDRKSVV